MRLGVIEFGTSLAETPSLLAALRERGVDIITKLAEPPQSARDESERLHRAECDGVLLTLGEDVVSDDVAEAMLFLHSPILVVSGAAKGDAAPVLLAEANAVVGALGVAVDFREPSELSAELLESWLHENSRSSRQKGIEAAHKLYGTRLLTDAPDDTGGFAFKMRWLQQFGVLVVGSSDADGVSRPDDLTVGDGTILGALTQRLLCLVSGLSEAIPIARGQLRGENLAEDNVTLTVALISTARASDSDRNLAWNFYGRVFQGVEIGEGAYAIGPKPLAFLESDADEKATLLYAIPGDFVGAVRAALNTLDVPTVVLRDDESRHRS